MPFMSKALLFNPPAAASVTYSTEAQAFFTRLSSQPTAPRKTLYAACIDAIVTAGVWTKLDALYLLAAADEATALTSLVSSTYDATASGAPTFTADQGHTGASAKFLDTNFNPTTAVSPQFAQDTATIFCWSLTSAANGGAMMGQASKMSIFPKWTDNSYYYNLNSTTQPGAAVANGLGFYLATRRGATDQKLFKDATQIDASGGPSSTPTNESIKIFKADGLSSTATCGVAGIGSKLTDGEITSLYNAIHTYMQTVAGVS